MKLYRTRTCSMNKSSCPVLSWMCTDLDLDAKLGDPNMSKGHHVLCRTCNYWRDLVRRRRGMASACHQNSLAGSIPRVRRCMGIHHEYPCTSDRLTLAAGSDPAF